MSDLIGHIGNLVRNEVDLARAEVAQNLDKVGASLGAMALAVALGIAGLNLLAMSLVALVIWAGLPPHWATLVVGAALILVALLIFRSARSTLHQIGFAPTRTARNVQRDAAAIKESIHAK
ncbi:phage holin family protein [Roseicyclus marinus]|nr:phage holin family protein [Roseicyclus marinus]MDG3042787.1 phage holin family protein [Roseicyclus marinus]